MQRSNTYRGRTAVLLVAVLRILIAIPASAQELPLAATDSVQEAKLKVGVIAMNPKVGITNFGWDSNVFNEVQNPKGDFTSTLTPGLDVWLRTGRGIFSLSGTADAVYFKDYTSQRSINSHAIGQYEYGFNRIRPYISASSLRTRDQPGFEIEARVQHYETQFQAGIDTRVGSKTNFRLNLQRRHYTFAGDEIYNGRPLNEGLNRTLDAINLSWRQRLTALTTWVVRGSAEKERFEFDAFRNSDSWRVASGFELGRFALIRGSAFAGYRKLKAAEGGILPEFAGLTADVNVAYTAPRDVRLTARVTRDLQYSYDRTHPYYLQTSLTAILTKRLIGRWEGQVTGGRDQLGYRYITPIPDSLADRIDRVGAGVGYALGDDVRIGFDVVSFYRDSTIATRNYGTVRAGLSVTYGANQSF